MFEDCLNQFEFYLHNTKKSSNNTISSYKRDLQKYCRYLEDKGITDCLKANNNDVNNYISELSKKGFSDSTISRYIASIRSFYVFLSLGNNTKVDVSIAAPKVIKKVPDILTVEEVELLLSQPSTNKPKHVRDRAMLELMYATGIRVTELIKLRVSDINLKSSYIICRDEDRQRIIPFGRTARRSLEVYLQTTRSVLVTDPNMHLLFTNYSGKEMSRQGFWKLIKGYAIKAGINTDITPHTLRHSFASHMLANGADIHVVSELLGHADISSTKIYENINNSRIRSVYETAHPRQ